jgi:hypothetical protein
MRFNLIIILLCSFFILLKGYAYESQKDWTVLVYLNGHNNLDSYGLEDINEMETVGSSDRVNVVVEWASLKNTDTRRLYITQDNTADVKSQVVESLSRVDMGDYKSLVEFIKWGMEKYPAKHYMVDVWNHGGGWHYVVNARGVAELRPQDISWDDVSGHVIKTEQLGPAMREVSIVRGEKIDIFGADACLMSMAEILSEVQDSVKIFAGSEEVEPGWA